MLQTHLNSKLHYSSNLTVPKCHKTNYKVEVSPSKKNCFIFSNESLLQVMKSAFYYTVKALFALKILKFLVDVLAKQKNSLIRKIRLISQFMTSQPGCKQ